jgi:hypothetical protein
MLPIKWRYLARTSIALWAALTAGACAARRAVSDEFLRLHPEFTSTQAFALERECPIPGLAIQDLAVVWGPPMSASSRDSGAVMWRLSTGVTILVRSDGGMVSESEVTFDEPWLAVAKRIGRIPTDIVKYLQSDSTVPPTVAYALLRDCVWLDMDEKHVDLLFGGQPQAVAFSDGVTRKSYMAGYEGQRFEVEFRRGRVLRWDFCGGAMSDRTQGPLCQVSPH